MGARKQVDRISPSPAPPRSFVFLRYDPPPPLRGPCPLFETISKYGGSGRQGHLCSLSSKQPSIKFSPNCIKGHRIKTYPSGSKTIIGGSQQSMLVTKQSAPPSFHSQTNRVSLGGARHKCYFDCLYITPSNRELGGRRAEALLANEVSLPPAWLSCIHIRIVCEHVCIHTQSSHPALARRNLN